MRYGYARVSSVGQQRNGNSLDAQVELLKQRGAEVIISECFTGRKVDRPKFTELLEKLQPGDELIVCKLDRFARSSKHGADLIQELVKRGVRVNILNMGVADNSSTGKLLLNIMFAFAEYEADMIAERTSEGKAEKKATDPNYKEGRKILEVPDFEKFFEKTKNGQMTVSDSCKELGISRSKWYSLCRGA
jgi:DNA invertase Pin-like site-specific DNA recombinase